MSMGRPPSRARVVVAICSIRLRRRELLGFAHQTLRHSDYILALKDRKDAVCLDRGLHLQTVERGQFRPSMNCSGRLTLSMRLRFSGLCTVTVDANWSDIAILVFPLIYLSSAAPISVVAALTLEIDIVERRCLGPTSGTSSP
ncbi:hypothetical protein KC333_g76 [Hortaea werneckii]|nr:hypothetical protein KC333_g76 [Hortaea werneckii]